MAKQKKKNNDRGNSSIVHYPEPEWKKRRLEDYAGRNFQNNHQWNDSGFKDEEAQRNKEERDLLKVKAQVLRKEKGQLKNVFMFF